MGCDIHLWIEGKDKKGNWFVANPRYVDYGEPSQIREVEEYDIGRSYLLFSALANVRNEQDIPFIQSNRGLPNDISKDVDFDAEKWEGTAHSFGYVFARELEEYYYNNENSDTPSIKDAAEQIFHLYNKLWHLSWQIIDSETWNTLNIDDIRLVFWFDN